MDHRTDFDRLSSPVYIAARAGAVDCAAAFSLATSWLAGSPQDPDATELAALSAECAQAGQPRMAEVALRLLAAAGFAPGFTEEPGWLESLEDAMRLVNRDVAATGVRPCRLRVHDVRLTWSSNAYVEAWNGFRANSDNISPDSGAAPAGALAAVADDAQEALMEALGTAWPGACPVHRLGVHAHVQAEAAVWWCSGDGGHAVTPIGEWQGS